MADHTVKSELLTEVAQLREDLKRSESKVVELSHLLASAQGTARNFRAAAELHPDGVWFSDPTGSLQYASPSFLELLGITMADAYGQGWMENIHSSDLDRMKEAWKHSIATGDPWETDLRVLNKDSSWRTFLVRGGPIKNEAGQVVAWVGLNLDITERAAAAESAGATEAAQILTGRENFIAKLSHELRTPLTPIGMAAAAWESDPALPAAVRQDMTMIRRNIDMEVRLIDDLLDLKRFAGGKVSLRFAPVDAHKEIRLAIEICREDLSSKRLMLDLNLEAGRPWVLADETRLRQVFWNLIRNACKFTPRGRTIGISSRSTENDRLQLLVTDASEGRSPSQIQALFQAVDEGEEDSGNDSEELGLGLTLAKKVVELHQGRIWAESGRTGRGLTLGVELPIVLDDHPRLPSPSSRPDYIPLAKRLRVLLVEDHRDTGRVLSRSLQSRGHIVNHAMSASTALKLAEEHEFDVVLGDLGLPDMDGCDLMAILREKYKLPGVALSGYGAESDIRKSAEAGFSSHITKPVLIEDLEHALLRAVRH